MGTVIGRSRFGNQPLDAATLKEAQRLDRILTTEWVYFNDAKRIVEEDAPNARMVGESTYPSVNENVFIDMVRYNMIDIDVKGRRDVGLLQGSTPYFVYRARKFAVRKEPR